MDSKYSYTCDVLIQKSHIQIYSIVDDEFNDQFKELTAYYDSEMTTEEYIDFDFEICTSVTVFNSDEVDWKKAA